MLENELLQEEQRTFVISSLTNLNHCRPRLLSFNLLTLIALIVLDGEFNDETLLQNGTLSMRQRTHRKKNSKNENELRKRKSAEHEYLKHFLLNGQLDLDSSRMWLGPYEAGIDQFHLKKKKKKDFATYSKATHVR
jgi:hypothetical protein